MTKIERVWMALGGRKQLNSYIGVAVLTFMALRMPGATFDTYALYLTLFILGQSAANIAAKKVGANAP